MSRFGLQRGQASTEYVGAIIAAALIVLVLLGAAGEIGGILREGVTRQVNSILDDRHAQSAGPPVDAERRATPVPGSRRPSDAREGARRGEDPVGAGDIVSGAGKAADEVSGFKDARAAVGDLAGGDILGALGHAAFAVPGAGKILKGGKLAKEGIEDAVEAGGKKAAREGDDLARRVPPYGGGKTRGALEVDGRQLDLVSGRKGPAAAIPKGTPGFDAYLRTHVEGHAAALLRQQGGGRARLAINQVPCPNCHRNLPRALPEGAELEVIGPDGFQRIYRGLPD